MTSSERYEPDQQDELIADAEAIGGRAFVEEVTFAAAALAARTCRWDGRGDEPAHYRSAWLAHARELIAARRAALSAGRIADPAPRSGGRPPPQ